MVIYWLNLSAVIVWAFILGRHQGSMKNRKALSIVLFVQLFLILALRSIYVGADVLNYISNFEYINSVNFMDFDFRFESGYVLLNKLMGFFTLNQNIFVAVNAFISLLLFFFFIHKESRIVWLSIFLFITLGFYTNLFNLFRQAIALGVVVNSYQLLRKGNFKLYFFVILIASSFHLSSLIFMPVYFFRNLKFSLKVILFYSATLVLVAILSNQINTIILSNFSSINYVTESRGGANFLIILVLVLIVGLIFKTSIIKTDPKSEILYHIQYFAILCQVLALDFALMTRVTRYFSIFLIIFIPNIISGVKDHKIIISGVYFLCCLTALFYYLTLRNDTSSIVPYHFFFN
ncbi:EpsG family protein [Amphibacillus marinus]|uniref:EpsG family protein n=1 Tax=Amphibacillus marinus TaxID=872970 RepID=A0A1H8N778_9BACI|nr:EpsG family protein [Amphibacillus marinus]SEO25293.1 EpsG family protein [Amphibacillus marinus]